MLMRFIVRTPAACSLLFSCAALGGLNLNKLLWWWCLYSAFCRFLPLCADDDNVCLSVSVLCLSDCLVRKCVLLLLLDFYLLILILNFEYYWKLYVYIYIYIYIYI